MGYDRYKDTNGVTWTIIVTRNGWAMVATVLDDADPKYQTPPADVMVDLPAPHDTGQGVEDATGEQQRVLFIDLQRKIEEYAKANRAGVVLKVKEKSGGLGVLVVLGLLYLVFKDD